MLDTIQRIVWKLWAWITRWFEVAGRIWASYWLIILGACFILASVVLRWLMFPFSRHLKGFQLPLLSTPGVIPRGHLLSYGVVAIVLLALGFLLRNRIRFALVIAATLLLTLWVLAPARVAFQQPVVLQRLVEQNIAAPMVRAFTHNYLPQNFGAAEVMPKHVDTVTLSGRLIGAVSFFGLGWYCFGLGSILVALYSLGQLPRGRGYPLLAMIFLPLAAVVIPSLPPLLGQHYFNKASVARAAGMNEEAITYYRKAMRCDSWHSQGVEVYAIIGHLERQAGINEGSAERAISRAVDFQESNQYEQAVFELERAAEMGGPSAGAARREAARTRLDLGLGYYRADAFGPAVITWAQALSEDPDLVYAYFYLGRGNYNLSRYQDAIDAVNKLLKITADHDQFLADTYSLGADAYSKLGREDDARRYYGKSLTIDPTENHWALTGLVGE